MKVNNYAEHIDQLDLLAEGEGLIVAWWQATTTTVLAV